MKTKTGSNLFWETYKEEFDKVTPEQLEMYGPLWLPKHGDKRVKLLCQSCFKKECRFTEWVSNRLSEEDKKFWKSFLKN